MVMVWLEGGQGEVRGACALPPPHPKSPHLDDGMPHRGGSGDRFVDKISPFRKVAKIF